MSENRFSLRHTDKNSRLYSAQTAPIVWRHTDSFSLRFKIKSLQIQFVRQDLSIFLEKLRKIVRQCKKEY
jgi:hypothetical protein